MIFFLEINIILDNFKSNLLDFEPLKTMKPSTT